ncbi:MAG: HAD family hydrolase [Candidatus Korobacteraceae bacterium]|jgi:D-glycero-D-manno-heptose 1,7-bisphosphate phosphatase
MGSNRAINFSNIEFVFLDRDGVLNRQPPDGRFVTCWEELEVLPGVEEAVAALNRSGRKVIVVTNQRGIALGLYSHDDLDRIHAQLQEHLAARGARLDGIYVCPHDEGQCNCRKPLTGLFEQAFRDFSAARPENSLMMGDSLRDIEAGLRLGMRTVFITGDVETSSTEADRARMLAQVSVASLSELVNRYLCLEKR